MFVTKVAVENACVLTVLPVDGFSVPPVKSLNRPESDASRNNAVYFVPAFTYVPKKPMSSASAALFAANSIRESCAIIVSTSCVTVLPITTKLPVTARSPVIDCAPELRTTVLSTSNFTELFAGTATDVIPSPPTNVSVSVSNEIVSVPVSPATFKPVATDTLAAEVIRPSTSTANVGITEPPP